MVICKWVQDATWSTRRCEIMPHDGARSTPTCFVVSSTRRWTTGACIACPILGPKCRGQDETVSRCAGRVGLMAEFDEFQYDFGQCDGEIFLRAVKEPVRKAESRVTQLGARCTTGPSNSKNFTFQEAKAVLQTASAVKHPPIPLQTAVDKAHVAGNAARRALSAPRVKAIGGGSSLMACRGSR